MSGGSRIRSRSRSIAPAGSRRSARLAALRRGLLVAGAAVLGLAAFLVGALLLLLYRQAHPPRAGGAETPGAVFTRYEDAPFSSVDRVPLAGWWIPGRAGAPVVILCHDLG